MMAYDRYFQEITALLNRIREGEREPIAKAAQLMADSIKNGELDPDFRDRPFPHHR